LRRWLLVTPHHKTTTSGKEGTCLQLTDAEEVKLLQLYEKYGRPVLLAVGAAQREGDDPHEQYLSDSGQPFTSTTLGHWWSKLHRDTSAAWFYVSLQQVRSVFVGDRRARPDVPGPSDAAAARGMGNTPRQWDASYDKGQHARLVYESQVGMQQYRSELRGGAGPSRAVATEAAEARTAPTASQQPMVGPHPHHSRHHSKSKSKRRQHKKHKQQRP
jgi:hypothetical protein